MMDSCLDCYCKHISTSMVYENEAKLGYPLHYWLAIGELCAAENEIINKYPDLAAITRQYRKDYMAKGLSIPSLQLIALATELSTVEIPEQIEKNVVDADK